MDPLLLGSLIGFGFALTEEQIKQTQILNSMWTYQTLQGATEAQPVPERTSHQKELVERASKACESKHYELALSFAERLLKLERSEPLYYILRGDCLARLGRISAAIEDYDRSLDMNDRTHSLSPYLEDSLKISVGQLEEIQSTISRSEQEPSLEEICRMLDEAKSKQAETNRTVDLSVSQPDETKSGQSEVTSTDAVKASQVTDLDIRRLAQDNAKEPLALFGKLNGKFASKASDRLVLYEISLETLAKLSNRAFVIFMVDKCRLPYLFSPFVYPRVWDRKSPDVLHGEIGGLPESLCHTAAQRGFRLHNMTDLRDSGTEAGAMFEQDFVQPDPSILAHTIEEMHLLATGDEHYAVRVDNWDDTRQQT